MWLRRNRNSELPEEMEQHIEEKAVVLMAAGAGMHFVELYDWRASNMDPVRALRLE